MDHISGTTHRAQLLWHPMLPSISGKDTQVTLTAVLWPAACSSSLLALHDAVTDIEAGRCDYAVVAGTSAIMSPNVTMGFNKLMVSHS